MVVEQRDLGRMPYGECWDLQRRIFDELCSAKTDDTDAAGTILTVEHPAVYTMGKSGKERNMLVSTEFLHGIGAEFYHIDRGGDVTFHGEGQIVCYPILDLERLGIGLRRYIELLEQSVIDTMQEWNIACGRIAGASGVWLWDTEADGEAKRNIRKICAIGVKASRFVTMHGLALNVNTDLRYFDYINPCGFSDRKATSMQHELGRPIDLTAVRERLIEHLTKNINVKKIYKN